MNSSKEMPQSGPIASFSVGDLVVYPTHGVGKVTMIETQTLGADKMKLFVISFERTRMTLRVPLLKATSSGLRQLSTRSIMQAALATLTARGSIKRIIWSRRTLEYAAKINSGDPVSIAEVVRDLYRPANEKEPSYSERQIYEQAFGRLTEEVAAVEKIDTVSAVAKLDALLSAA